MVKKRSSKFYFRNEKEVMLDLGLQPTKGSGSGWIEKEDGENDFILAQLKSTDKESIKLNFLDIEKLEYHASVSHKVPVFIIQHLQTGDIFALTRLTNIPDVSEYIKTGRCEKQDSVIELQDVQAKPDKKKIISGNKKKFWNDREKEMAKRYGKKG